jgi:hypothetical protein
MSKRKKGINRNPVDRTPNPVGIVMAAAAGAGAVCAFSVVVVEVVVDIFTLIQE